MRYFLDKDKLLVVDGEEVREIKELGVAAHAEMLIYDPNTNVTNWRRAPQKPTKSTEIVGLSHKLTKPKKTSSTEKPSSLTRDRIKAFRAEGKSAKEMADELGISPQAVNYHMRALTKPGSGMMIRKPQKTEVVAEVEDYVPVANEDEVLRIWQARDEGLNTGQISFRLGLSPLTVNKVLSGNRPLAAELPEEADEETNELAGEQVETETIDAIDSDEEERALADRIDERWAKGGKSSVAVCDELNISLAKFSRLTEKYNIKRG